MAAMASPKMHRGHGRSHIKASSPDGVPERIVADTLNQPGAQRVGDDVSRDLLQVLFPAHGMVMEARRPEPLLFCKRLVPLPCRSRFGTPDITRQGLACAKLQQTVPMIGHEHPAQKTRIGPGLLAGEKRSDHLRRGPLDKVSPPSGRRESDQIDAPCFRPAAVTQGTRMRKIHGCRIDFIKQTIHPCESRTLVGKLLLIHYPCGSGHGRDDSPAMHGGHGRSHRAQIRILRTPACRPRPPPARNRRWRTRRTGSSAPAGSPAAAGWRA